MHAITAIAAFAGLAAAQGVDGYDSSSYLSTNPGGAVPVGTMHPGIGGFAMSDSLPARGGYAVCTSGIIRVPASTNKNMKFNFNTPVNQTGVTETFLEFITDGSPFMKQIAGPMTNVSGTYDIAGTLCTPGNDTKPTEVQVLTHGIGFDRYYWDFAPGYSWVDVAALRGKATFLYDRLGVGMSQKADGLNVIQTPIEAEILNSIVGMLRQGQIGNTTFSKVVGVGHSFGSILTQAVTEAHPTTFDGAVLTGFSTNMTGLAPFTMGLNLNLASVNNQYRFAGLPNEYLVSDTAISLQIAFARAPGFDPSMLSLAEAMKGSVTYGELFSQMAVGGPAKDFKGPVVVLNGAEDLPFCFGNCSYPMNKADAVKMLYPGIQQNQFASYLAPTSGHGLNIHYSAVGAYEFAQDFLAKNGVN